MTKTLKELLTIESAIFANNISQNVGLWIRQTSNWMELYLVNIDTVESAIIDDVVDVERTEEALIGGISAELNDNLWHVTLVFAQKGFGPFLYQLAMELATSAGSALAPDASGHTSPAAHRVWDKFETNPNVEKQDFGDGKFGFASYSNDYEAINSRFCKSKISLKHIKQLEKIWENVVFRNASDW